MPVTHQILLLRDQPQEERLDGFRVTKKSGGSTLSAVCDVAAHPQGWRLQLTVDGRDQPVSSIVASSSDMLKTVRRWRAALVSNGWR